MRKILKLLVIWLVLVAPPLQGWTATTVGCAGSDRHTGAPSNDKQDRSALEAHVRKPSVHDHAVVASSSVGDSADAVHQYASRDEAVKCSACAACCSGVAIAANLQPSLPSLRSTVSEIAFRPAYFYGFVPETLERPPYRLLS